MTLFAPGPSLGHEHDTESSAVQGTHPEAAGEGTPPPEAEPTHRVCMTLSYDGTGFSGFAKQPGRKTVAGELVKALERAVGTPVDLVCAGRTDAGVHATHQVVHFDVPSTRADPTRLAGAVNRQLAPVVVVKKACMAGAGFDARRSATSRRYRYRIDNSPLPDPLKARYTWWVRQPLDLALLRLGTDALIGEHDFSAFCRRPPGHSGALVRRVLDASWSAERGELSFEIEALSFCHQMVRSIVGMLARVGRGRLAPGEVSSIIASCDRARAGSPAPARGLCLIDVRYGTCKPPEARAASEAL